jgi:hypothetical protein
MSERRLLLTRRLDESDTLLTDITSPTLSSYASRLGVDLAAISEQKIPGTHGEWSKLQIADFLDTYDRVLYIDPDCIIREDTPDLFALVPPGSLGILDESAYVTRDLSLVKAASQLLGQSADARSYYNSGVLVVSREHKPLFEKPADPMLGFRFDEYFSALIALRAAPVHKLDYRFNRLPQFDSTSGEERFESYIVHYSGYPSAEIIAPLIEHDLSVWKEANGNHRYPRHYLISADGGLGDHVTAEPVIRFLKTHLRPEDDLRIAAHWPRVFEHLPVPVQQHNTPMPAADFAYRTLWTLPNPESVLGRSICSLLCHAIEHHSITMLSRMLPLKDREIRLAVTDADKNDLAALLGGTSPEQLVLVHAGKSWASKTFPLAWWQAVVDALAAQGMTVCVIGKSASHLPEDTTGTVPILAPAGAIDLRDKLGLGPLFALISAAPVLLSNDSSPVQIAGAFDNWIVMIATVKPPDLVFPYRQGSTQYKTKALFKRLLVDDIPLDPINPVQMNIDFEVADWSPYLPEPLEVAAEVALLYKNGTSL